MPGNRTDPSSSLGVLTWGWSREEADEVQKEDGAGFGAVNEGGNSLPREMSFEPKLWEASHGMPICLVPSCH